MITLDLDKCYGCTKCRQAQPGLYSLIERGIRAVVCRHCENPACVAACPQEALEKKEGEDLVRYLMKCVSCKQCASACPVGANPEELLTYKTYPAYKLDIERCKKICKQGAIDEVEKTPDGWIEIDGIVAVKAKDWK
ncbi:MAG: 4Fe-4S dicluster domain-containing protein [Elusimicrobiota bacterium]